MSDLPTGTVTFLFTNIQGSTYLWKQSYTRWLRLDRDHGMTFHGRDHGSSTGHSSWLPDCSLPTHRAGAESRITCTRTAARRRFFAT